MTFDNPRKSNWIRPLRLLVRGVTVRRNFTFRERDKTYEELLAIDRDIKAVKWVSGMVGSIPHPISRIIELVGPGSLKPGLADAEFATFSKKVLARTASP